MKLYYSPVACSFAPHIALQEAGIRFDVSSDGTKVLVSAAQTAQARMLLAEKGLPSSSNAGYELFDNVGSLGLTSFMQQITRVRALEGEIARTIQSLAGIKAARVHIVMSERANFRRDEQQPLDQRVVAKGQFAAGRQIIDEQDDRPDGEGADQPALTAGKAPAGPFHEQCVLPHEEPKRRRDNGDVGRGEKGRSRQPAIAFDLHQCGEPDGRAHGSAEACRGGGKPGDQESQTIAQSTRQSRREKQGDDIKDRDGRNDGNQIKHRQRRLSSTS